MNRAALLSGDLPPEVAGRRHLALEMADAALDAVDSTACTARALAALAADGVALEQCTVFAFGKASVGMTRAALDAPFRVRGGIVHALEPASLGPLTVRIASHPMPAPDAAEQGHAMLAAARALGPDDVALCLVSGGGSAMLEAPRDGVTVQQIRAESARLMAEGADIHQLNAARRRLSAIKGGGLAEAIRPARIVNVILSDVPGGPLSVVASGPTLETDAAAEGVHTVLAADNLVAVRAAAASARRAGVLVAPIDEPIVGEARLAGARLARTTRSCVAGGETTVEVVGAGRGGRNQEVVLGAVHAGLQGLVLALGTDGVDGPSDAAGALADEQVAARAAAQGLDPERYLADNASNSFFRAVGATLSTGRTGTNVADLYIRLSPEVLGL